MALRRIIIGIVLGILLGVTGSSESSLDSYYDFPLIQAFRLSPVLAADDEDDDENCLDEPAPEGESRVCQKRGGIPLIQPLDDETPSITVDFSTPQAMWLALTETRMGWVVEMATGVVAIWILICGGAMILVGDPNKAWRTRMLTSIVGLLGLVFFSAILKLLNAAFFTN